jgi:hypothetical protein
VADMTPRQLTAFKVVMSAFAVAIVGIGIAIYRIDGQSAAKLARGGPLYGSAACQKVGNFRTAEEFHDACNAPVLLTVARPAQSSRAAAEVCSAFDTLMRSGARGRVSDARLLARLQQLSVDAKAADTKVYQWLQVMVGAVQNNNDENFGHGMQQVQAACGQGGR